MKLKKPTPTQLLKERIAELERMNFQLNQQVASLNREMTVHKNYATSPPTIMIACEKIVEAAVQLTCSANALIDKSRR